MSQTQQESGLSFEMQPQGQDKHCHSDNNLDPNRNRTAKIKLIIVFILCVIFMIGEIVGGLIANSISIQTDAAHMAADIAGYFFSLVAIFVSEKKPTRRMSFGFYRSEVLGALLSILVILVLTGVLVYLAIQRVITLAFEIEPRAMVITASCGVLFNIVMFFVLNTSVFRAIYRRIRPVKKDQKGASDAEAGTKPKAKEEQNINLRAAAIHVIGDSLQSIGVLIAAVIIYINPEYKIADPICTFVFSAFVVVSTVRIIKDIMLVLMEVSIKNVKKIHDLHVWSLSLDTLLLAVHLVIENELNAQQVLADANELLKRKYNLKKAFIQVECFTEEMSSCPQCTLPK